MFRHAKSHLSATTLIFLATLPLANAASFNPAGEDPDNDSIRINAYFMDIGEFETTCEEIQLYYEDGLLEHIQESDKQKFLDIFRQGGTAATKAEEIEELRKSIRPLSEAWLFAALDVHNRRRALANNTSELSNSEIFAWSQQIDSEERELLYAYYQHLWAQTRLYVAESQLRGIVKEYYDLIATPPKTPRPFRISFFDPVDPEIARKKAAAQEPPRPSPFDTLTASQQARMIEKLYKRLNCLRKERLDTFHLLSENTIQLEQSVAHYIQATTKMKLTIADTNRVDEANAQIKRSVLQQKYLWLSEEFANNAAICKNLLLAHERKLRNSELFPVLQKQQQAQPHLGPHSLLNPDFPGLREAQQKVSKVRARVALIGLMEDEAKLEGASMANASAALYLMDALKTEASTWMEGVKNINLFLRDKGAAEGIWKAKTPVDALTAFVGISYHLTTNSFNTILATPLKDKMIVSSRNAGWLTGLKTSAQNNYKTYNEASGTITRRINYIKGLEKRLSHAYAQDILRQMYQPKDDLLNELLADHSFNSGNQGGIAYILSPFMDRSMDHRALWLLSARSALWGARQTARDRILASQGKEVANPYAEASVADIKLGALSVLNEPSDMLFKIPTMWRNFVGQFGAVQQDQQSFMATLDSQYEAVNELLPKLARAQFSLETLRRSDRAAYTQYILLTQTCVEWNVADYNIQHEHWQRIKRYNSMLDKLRGRNQRFEGEVRFAETQRQEEARFAALSTRQGFLKLQYMIHTANYAAAVLQTKKLEELENIRRRNLGIKQKANYTELEADLRIKAVANQAVTAWEALLNQAITTVVTSKFSTYMHERMLSHFNPKWLARYGDDLAEEALDFSMKAQFLDTFVPWSRVCSQQGVLNLVTGTAVDVTKSKIAEEIAKTANKYWYGKANYAQGSDYEAVVGELWDLGSDLRSQLQTIAISNFVAHRMESAALDAKYQNALEEADRARNALKGQLLAQEIDGEESSSISNTIKDLFDDNELIDLPPQERQQRLDQLVESGAANTRMEKLRTDYARYHRALVDLDTEYGAYKSRLGVINNILLAGMKVSSTFRYALEDVQKLDWQADHNRTHQRIRGAAVDRAVQGTRDLFDEYARAELRTRLVLGSHTLEDLEAMVSDDPWVNLNMPNVLLRRSNDIDAMRRVLNSSIDEALAKRRQADPEGNPRENNPEYDRVMAVAEKIDSIRINKINTLLADFLDESGHGNDMVLVIQGGAAKGNPEYQGIFGDIDFTLMLKPNHFEGKDRDAQYKKHQEDIKEKLLQYFEKNGYPLARSKDDESSMDSEAFIQPFDKFITEDAELKDAISDIVSKSKDPTRFYSEGGTEWFINNAAYSGKVLWPNKGSGVEWVDVHPSRGHGLAIDMARYLGFLGSPKYTKEYLDAHPEDKKEYLANALSKTKYFIRLIDAYEMGHPEGNKLYNSRKDRERKDSRDESYHWQIFKDALELIRNPDPNDPNPVLKPGDEDHIELMAMMKLKGEFTSPWAAIQKKYPGISEEEQMIKAQETIDWMRDTAPKIFADLNERWHNHAVARAASDDPREQAILRSEKHRKMSTLKTAIANDGTEIAMFLTPKAKNGVTLTRQQQEDIIATNLRNSAGIPPASQKIDQAAKNAPSDPQAAQAQIASAAAAAKADIQAVPANADIFAIDEHYIDWLSYIANLSAEK
ncbi:MAG: hypothetical protein F6K21_08330 [Symploca sp. SIO2D2]|nr:hypothetical protein [Symploca sp. SIO2D2]